MEQVKSLVMSDSLIVTLVGMSIVFIGLFVLILLIKALILVTDKIGRPQKQIKHIELPKTAAAAAQPSEEDSEELSASDDGEIVAAIMAAVSMVLQEDASSFVVRRIRRVPRASAGRA